MATFQVGIFSANTLPDNSGRCYFEPFDVKASNDVWKNLVGVFAQPSTQTHGIYGQFTVPQNYAGTAAIIPVWTSSATSGNCKWTFNYRTVAGDDAASLDQSGFEESPTVTDVAPTAAFRRLTPSVAPTAANFAAGETVEFYFTRSDAATSEMAAAALLFDLLFQYTDA